MAEDVMPDDIPVVVDRRVSFDRDFAVCGVDPGDHQLTVVMAIARSSAGEVLVLDEMRVDAPPGMTTDTLFAILVDFARELERTKVAMGDLKDALAAVRLSRFDPAVGIATGVYAERLVRAETTRCYDDPDIQKVEDLAVRTVPTTNSRGRWRRTKSRRCMKCNAIINDGQTCCHRCGSKRIQ